MTPFLLSWSFAGWFFFFMILAWVGMQKKPAWVYWTAYAFMVINGLHFFNIEAPAKAKLARINSLLSEVEEHWRQVGLLKSQQAEFIHPRRNQAVKKHIVEADVDSD